MPKAFLTNLHYAFIKATQKELTTLQKRSYIFDESGNPSYTLQTGETVQAIDGPVRCISVTANNLHRFEIGTEPPNAEQAAYHPEWLEKTKNIPTPGIFRSSSNISGTSPYAVYALAAEDYAALQESLTHWPHIFVRINGSYQLTRVKPRDCLVFPDDKYIRIPEYPLFLHQEAKSYWDLANL